MSFWIFLAIMFSWAFVGFITFIVTCIIDMRDSEYDENYLDKDMAGALVMCMLCGCVAPFIIFIAMLPWKNMSIKFTKWMYKIANHKRK